MGSTSAKGAATNPTAAEPIETYACSLEEGSNPYRLGTPEKVIQHILRHANVSTTAAYYIEMAVGDIRTR
jgi:integrase